jgi:hypothetical protein
MRTYSADESIQATALPGLKVVLAKVFPKAKV